MDLSFQEKSLWLQVAGVALVFGVYFTWALPPASVDVLPQHVAVFAVLVALLALIQVVGHVALVIVDRRGHDGDERARWIELVAVRNAAYVLATGVFFSLCIALIVDGNFVFTHVLLGFWVLAQLVEFASQLVLFRRSA